MAMLPVLLDMVDEIYDSLDKPAKSANFPFLYFPQTRRGTCPRRQGIRCPMRAGRDNGCNIKKCTTNEICGSDCFKVTINVQSFKPEEIAVKVKGHEVIIEGKHEEREDEHGFVSRQFTRRYVLPEEYDMETVTTTLDTEGILMITAQKPKPVEGPQERVIPIERVPSVIEQPSTSVENGEEEKKKEAEFTLEDAVE